LQRKGGLFWLTRERKRLYQERGRAFEITAKKKLPRGSHKSPFPSGSARERARRGGSSVSPSGGERPHRGALDENNVRKPFLPSRGKERRGGGT